jgi:hypothetical protein
VHLGVFDQPKKLIFPAGGQRSNENHRAKVLGGGVRDAHNPSLPPFRKRRNCPTFVIFSLPDRQARGVRGDYKKMFFQEWFD